MSRLRMALPAHGQEVSRLSCKVCRTASDELIATGLIIASTASSVRWGVVRRPNNRRCETALFPAIVAVFERLAKNDSQAQYERRGTLEL